MGLFARLGGMTEGRQRRFGRTSEEANEVEVDLLTYGGYLKLPDLLSLQQLLSDPPVHDELLFIVVHQAYELWFKQLLFELESVRDRLFEGDTERARHYLKRVHAIERVLIEHIEVLETMSPQDFLAFRDHLAPASGFQSAQFRELEFISGLKDERLLEDLAASPEERDRLANAGSAEPTLWDGFCALLEANGLPMPADDDEQRTASLVAMAREQQELFAVSEAMLDHDESVARWRSLHVLMVEREIGAKRGTGGSSGVGYLRTTLGQAVLPGALGAPGRSLDAVPRPEVSLRCSVRDRPCDGPVSCSPRRSSLGACTQPAADDETPSPSGASTESPSVVPTGARMPDGTPLPAGCTGGAGATRDRRVRRRRPRVGAQPGRRRPRVPVPGRGRRPFAWGPQGDRVLLNGFEIRGVGGDAPDLPAIDTSVSAFDWGHPLGLAVVFADARASRGSATSTRIA